MSITFYGASDDLVEVEGCPGADEFNVYGPAIMCWRGDLVAPDGSTMRISALYESCWSFAVGQADEDHPLPEWPVRIAQSPEVRYSVLLEVDAPDGTTLTNIWPSVEDL